jgi:hypothetical protein
LRKLLTCSFPPMFSSSSFMVFRLTFKFQIHFQLILNLVEEIQNPMNIHFHSSTCEYSLF